MTDGDRDRLLAALSGLLGPRGLLTGPEEMVPFTTEFRGRHSGHAIAVALPSSIAEASEAVRLATDAGLAVFPQGGNSGLCYGTVPKDGLVIGLRRLAECRMLDVESGLMTVDAGATLSQVHEWAGEAGLAFPMYLGSEGTAQIGGLLSTNAGGTGVLRYGSMRALCVGIEAVLADGRVLSDLAGLAKDNTGYQVRQLFVGAEGTLGLVTGATLRLVPMIRTRAHAWLSVADPTMAVTLLARLKIACGDVLEAFEMIDHAQAQWVISHVTGARLPFAEPPDWSVMIELASMRDEPELADRLETVLAEAWNEGLILDAVVAKTEKQAREIWHFRHSVTEANRTEGIGVVLDTAVRTRDVPAFIEAATQAVLDAYPMAQRGIVSHLGDGNVHFIVMFPRDWWTNQPDPTAIELQVEQIVHDIAFRFGGTFSAEHGIGRKLTTEMVRLVDPVRLSMMIAIKKALDPDNLMNPDAVLPANYLKSDIVSAEK